MGFSFGAGNVAKIVRIPLYALGRAATLVIPRRRDAWVFGCAAGVTDGALVLWRRAARDGHDMVWLTNGPREEREADELGIPHVPTYSVRGFWTTARARVVVVTHGQGDANRYAIGGSYLVQLWHGIPLKRLGLDSPETLRTGILPDVAVVRALLRVAYRNTQRAIRLLPAASAPVARRLGSAFGLGPDRVRVTGEPRVDVLSVDDACADDACADNSSGDRRERARRLVVQHTGPVSESARIVLYAPTWRDGDIDPGVPTEAEWRQIDEVLARCDAVLLIRSHPLGQGEYAPPTVSERIRMLPASVVPDVTPALAALDVLVTDYSSLGYDVGLLSMPVVWFAPDEQTYVARRGLYGTYADVAPQPTRTWEETLRAVEAILGDDEARRVAADRSAALSSEVHAFRDGANVERVYRIILDEALPRRR